MRAMLLNLLTVVFSLSAFAGNGIERGYVLQGTNTDLSPVIVNYLDKKLQGCRTSDGLNTFTIKSVGKWKDRVDQGIIDIYYLIDIEHISPEGSGAINVEIVDSAYSNWTDYEEKLSIRLVKDEKQICQ